jgi:hypothetical protein
LRTSFKTSDKREAVRQEKPRIADAQNGAGLLCRKTVGLTVPEAAEAYIARPTPLVAPRTLELEQGAVKHLSKHLARVTLAKPNGDALTSSLTRRKAEDAGNRTINIEIGVLRRVLKQYRMWQIVSDGYKQLPEPKDIVGPSARSRNSGCSRSPAAVPSGRWRSWSRWFRLPRPLAVARSETYGCETSTSSQRR